MGKWLTGIALALLLLCRPEDAANGAREALRQWYFTVAPALFPFMALLPLLTSPEGNGACNAALGGLMQRLFGLPGSAAAPVVAGMIAGSPAGCVAAKRVAIEEGWPRGRLERVALACCGLSPAFYISAVGAGMLKDAALGHVLLRSQMLSQLTMLGLTGLFCRSEATVDATLKDAAASPVTAIIHVAGTMALFGAIAGAMRWPWAHLMLEVTAGTRLLCGLDLDMPRKLAALSALTAWGGACACTQNIGALKGCGIHPAKFVAARCAAGLLAAGFTLLDRMAFPAYPPKAFAMSCVLALLMAAPAILRLKRTIF